MTPDKLRAEIIEILEHYLCEYDDKVTGITADAILTLMPQWISVDTPPTRADQYLVTNLDLTDDSPIPYTSIEYWNGSWDIHEGIEQIIAWREKPKPYIPLPPPPTEKKLTPEEKEVLSSALKSSSKLIDPPNTDKE